MFTAVESSYQGMPCIELKTPSYFAIVAHTLGGNVLRLRQTKKNVEIFRFNENKPISEIAESIEIYGLPTMYLPNRLDNGILRVSDHTYRLPMNEGEPYFNTLHGFLHRRSYKVVRLCADDISAKVTLSYVYDENDPFFTCFPVSFEAELELTLTENGLYHSFRLKNLSDRMLPVSVATHTTINAPFVDGAKQENIRLKASLGRRCELNERCLPTQRLLPHNHHDNEYISGEKRPVLCVVNNEMYEGGHLDLDDRTIHGLYAVDLESGIKIVYEVSEEYAFWIFWNQWGFEGYFCPEPMTAMINAPNLLLPREVTGYRELLPEGVFSCEQHFSVE